jgi:hypothetical protein
MFITTRENKLIYQLLSTFSMPYLGLKFLYEHGLGIQIQCGEDCDLFAIFNGIGSVASAPSPFVSNNIKAIMVTSFPLS